MEIALQLVGRKFRHGTTRTAAAHSHDFAHDAQGNLFRGLRADAQTGRGMDLSSLFAGQACSLKIFKYQLGSGAAGNQSDISRLTLDCFLKRKNMTLLV